jgi:tRNA dimethylallyltransferase
MMFDEWLVKEVENLRKIYSDETPGLQTIWYIEVVDYLKWNSTLEECIGLVQQHNRNYAKRQLTWFGKYKKYF